MDAFEACRKQIGGGMFNYLDIFEEIPKNQKILEIGCGTGELGNKLVDFNNTYVGIDAGLNNHLQEYPSRKGCFLYMDLSYERIPFIDHYFDTVIAYEIFEHLTNPYHCLSEVKRVLIPNQELVLSIPDYDMKVGYNLNQHAFVYPGLFKKKYFEKFMMQLYFKKIKEQRVKTPRNDDDKRKYHIVQAYKNIYAGDKIDILKGVNGMPFDEKEMYKEVMENGFLDKKD